MNNQPPMTPPINYNTFGQYPSYPGSQNVEVLKYATTGLAPIRIVEKYWGPMTKAIGLGSFSMGDKDDLEYNYDNVVMEMFENMTDDDIDTFELSELSQLKMVFIGEFGINQQNIVQRATESRVITENNSSGGSFNLKEFLTGRKSANSGSGGMMQ